MATLEENLQEIKRQKDTFIKPENLKEGITCFGITGTLTGTVNAGLDTSDATAESKYIAADKTAYVKGEKITGTAIKNYLIC